jgi:hypothetical protein
MVDKIESISHFFEIGCYVKSPLVLEDQNELGAEFLFVFRKEDFTENLDILIFH